MAHSDAPIDPEALRPALSYLLKRVAAQGADGADAVATHGRSLSISVREGALEEVDNSENRDLGLRVIIGQRQACVSSSDMSRPSLDILADRAVAMARSATEDPYCGLVDEALLETRPQDMELFDETVMNPEDLKDRAVDVEKATLSVKGVVQAERAGASWATSGVYYMTSHGFASGWRSSRHDLGVMAIAATDSYMERDMDYQGTRWLCDLTSPEKIGLKAAQRAVARLGSQQMKSGQMPIIFERRIAGEFISSLVGAINGRAIARGTSFLKDHLGQAIFPKTINIYDDPFIKRGHGSRPWDGEGVTVSKTKIVENGVLKTWLLNNPTARQLSLKTTGHAHRGIGSPPGIGPSNIYLDNGTQSPEEMLASIGQGVWITEMFGPSLNPNTGDYSVGVAGFAIENGERTYPVSEVTVAGNLLDIFANISAANDLKFDGSIVAPTLKIESLTLAGT